MATNKTVIDTHNVSVVSLEDGSFEWTNQATVHRLRRGGPEGVRAVDLLLASLGMCVAGTVQNFAKTHGIDGLVGVKTELTATEASKPTRVVSIAVKLTLEGEISDDEEIRLRRAGDHCKIHNTLNQTVSIDIH